MSDPTVDKIVKKLYDTEPDPFDRHFKRSFAIEPTTWDDTGTLHDLVIQTSPSMSSATSLTDDEMALLVFTILGHLPERYRQEVRSWL
jgi:hypothetical protein